LTQRTGSMRPLAALTAAYAAGVGAGCALRPAPLVVLAVGLAAVGAAAVGLLSVPTSGGRSRFQGRNALRRVPWTFSVFLAALAAGMLLAALAWERVDAGPRGAGGREYGTPGLFLPAAQWVTVEGRVVSEPRPTGSGLTFYLRAARAGAGWRRGETLYVYVFAGRDRGPGSEQAVAHGAWRPGDEVRVSGSLGRPRPPANPGQFDFPLYLAVRGVRYTLSAAEQRVSKVDGPGAGPLVRFTGACRAARDRLTAAIDRSLPPDQAALLEGLLFGDTSRLPEETARDFRRCGVFHILAVSGSNVAFVAGGFWLVSRPLLRGLGLRGRRLDRVLYPGTAVLLAAYAVMTGLGPSVVRATIMAEAGLLYFWLGRRRDVTGPLCLAALAMLGPRPLLILDVGFQLSYAATLGILFIYPPLRRALEPGLFSRLHRWLRLPLEAALVSLAAQAAVTPILARHFGEVSLAGLGANAAIVPLSGAAVTLGLGAGLAGAMGTPAGPLATPLFFATSPRLGCPGGGPGPRPAAGAPDPRVGGCRGRRRSGGGSGTRMAARRRFRGGDNLPFRRAGRRRPHRPAGREDHAR